jgi:hypothetical protein
MMKDWAGHRHQGLAYCRMHFVEASPEIIILKLIPMLQLYFNVHFATDDVQHKSII